MRLVAYQIHPMQAFGIEAMGHTRAWMDDSTNRFAYRCLPLVIANQFGWALPCPVAFEVTWNGDPAPGKGLAFTFDEPKHPLAAYVQDHFGHGILTFNIPYLFRTEPGYGLLVRGPTNAWVLNAHPLDGFVETDWLESTFTMNWKILEPHRACRFEQGFPICQLLPYPSGLLASVEPSVVPLSSEPALAERFGRWSAGRDAFNGDPERKPADWQKHYFQGKTVDGAPAEGHLTHLALKPFVPREG